jgi:hypothetical protein
MLTTQQCRHIKEGFKLGLHDTLIAKRLDLSLHEVYKFRRKLKISARSVLENRLNTWARLIKEGTSLDLLSEMYDVKPTSIQQMLWRELGFSFREAKRESLMVVSVSKQTRNIKKSAFELLGLS